MISITPINNSSFYFPLTNPSLSPPWQALTFYLQLLFELYLLMVKSESSFNKTSNNLLHGLYWSKHELLRQYNKNVSKTLGMKSGYQMYMDSRPANPTNAIDFIDNGALTSTSHICPPRRTKSLSRNYKCWR